MKDEDIEIINVRSWGERIQDGVPFRAGHCASLNILFSLNLIARLSKEELLILLIEGIVTAEYIGITEDPATETYRIGDTQVLVHYAGREVTFLLPEDNSAKRL